MMLMISHVLMMKQTQKTVINSHNGWVDLYDVPILTEDKKNYFLRLPSMQSEVDGYFRHIALLSSDVSTSFDDRTPLFSFDGSEES